MVFPPVDEDYDEMVLSGYLAALSWDGTYKTKIGTRFANVQVLLLLWPIKFLEIIITAFEDIFITFYQVLMFFLRSISNIAVGGK